MSSVQKVRGSFQEHYTGADPGFQARGADLRKLFGYFVWKITILRQKIIFFSNFRGGAPGAPPGSAPADWTVLEYEYENRTRKFIHRSAWLFYFSISIQLIVGNSLSKCLVYVTLERKALFYYEHDSPFLFSKIWLNNFAVVFKLSLPNRLCH